MCPGIYGCGCVRHSMRRCFFFLSGLGRGGLLLVSMRLITYFSFVSTCVWSRRRYILSAGSCCVCLSSQRKCLLALFFVSASCGACEGLGCVHGVCVLDAACSFLSLGATSLPSCRAGRLSRLLVISCHTLCAFRFRALMFHASP